MAERFNAAVLKTVVPKGTGGSNPSFSAEKKPWRPLGLFSFLALANALGMFYTYILKSEKTGRFYYGATSNLEERLKYHNTGQVRSTKHGAPWVVHYFEEFPTMEMALQREKFFKSVDGYRFLKENRIT
jgi:putative endonuclease